MTPQNLIDEIVRALTITALDKLEEQGEGYLAMLLNKLRQSPNTGPAVPSIGSIWRHKKGAVYEVYDITNRNTTKPDEFPVTVSYRNLDTGETFSRALWRWHDSFTPVEPETMPAIAGPGSNTGHGHVWSRPDGQRARCGGPGLCKICSTDAARWGLNR